MEQRLISETTKFNFNKTLQPLLKVGWYINSNINTTSVKGFSLQGSISGSSSSFLGFGIGSIDGYIEGSDTAKEDLFSALVERTEDTRKIAIDNVGLWSALKISGPLMKSCSSMGEEYCSISLEYLQSSVEYSDLVYKDRTMFCPNDYLNVKDVPEDRNCQCYRLHGAGKVCLFCGNYLTKVYKARINAGHDLYSRLRCTV